MHCVGGHTLVSVLIVAALITLLLLKTFSLLVCTLFALKLLDTQVGRPTMHDWIAYLTRRNSQTSQLGPGEWPRICTMQTGRAVEDPCAYAEIRWSILTPTSHQRTLSGGCFPTFPSYIQYAQCQLNMRVRVTQESLASLSRVTRRSLACNSQAKPLVTREWNSPVQ